MDDVQTDIERMLSFTNRSEEMYIVGEFLRKNIEEVDKFNKDLIQHQIMPQDQPQTMMDKDLTIE